MTHNKFLFHINESFLSIHHYPSQALLSVAPLSVSGGIREDEETFWTLPLLKRYVINTELSYFEDHFVHLAGKWGMGLSGWNSNAASQE